MMTLPAIVPPPGVHDTNVLLLMCSVSVPFATGQDASALVVMTLAPPRTGRPLGQLTVSK